MKKILIPIGIILLILPFITVIIGKNKITDNEFYALKQNYSFVEDKDRRMSFYVYSLSSNNLISDSNLNSYQIKLDSQSFNLENVECIETKSNSITYIKITADVPDITNEEYKSETCKMIITNGSYKLSLDLGTFSILDSKYYKYAKLANLSGTYTKIDNKRDLVGINITFDDDYEYLESFRIGGYTFGTLSRAKFNLELDSESDIRDYILNYNINKVEIEYTLSLTSNKLFIPLGYLNKYFIKEGYIVFKVNGENYYFETFPFLVTQPSYDDFKDFMIKGELLNV